MIIYGCLTAIRQHRPVDIRRADSLIRIRRLFIDLVFYRSLRFASQLSAFHAECALHRRIVVDGIQHLIHNRFLIPCEISSFPSPILKRCLFCLFFFFGSPLFRFLRKIESAVTETDLFNLLPVL